MLQTFVNSLIINIKPLTTIHMAVVQVWSLKPQPIFDAVASIEIDNAKKTRVILLCPQGEQYNQQKAEELAK